MSANGKTWKEVKFNDVYDEKRKKNRIIGLSFPQQNTSLGLEPAILTVLPKGKEVEYSNENILFNDQDVKYYACSVYISGMDEFARWAEKHDRNKIIVGGYHPTTFPEEFLRYASKIVQGPCDDFYNTITQEGQIVKGITNYINTPRYDLYDVKLNQQIIPDKNKYDIVTSINTSQGCPYSCDFCCTPMMSPKLLSKPIDLVEKEIEYLKTLNPKFIFIRDENFTVQKTWKERLELINKTGAKIYLFASANTLNSESIKFMAKNNVYMICLGLEDINVNYSKNKNLEQVVLKLKENGIYTYLSFIVNPLNIIGKEKGIEFYSKLMETFYKLKPEMVCGNFLMPFRGTKIWDEYYAYISKDDYKHYDSKTAFLIRNEIVREKMHFFMFWYQYKYYTSDLYNNQIRKFDVHDTLHERFIELNEEFEKKYQRIWNIRA